MLVDGILFAVTVYRKEAMAVARAITNPNRDPLVTALQDSADTAAIHIETTED